MCSHRYWHFCIFLFLFLGLTSIACAQYDGFRVITDQQSFRESFHKEASKVQSIKSDFVQEKNLSMLEEKIVSTGKFYFKRENKVHLEYESPFRYVMIMNQDQMLVRDESKESRLNVKSSKLFQQINRIMVDAVQGTMLNNTDFSIRSFENKEQYLLELTPVSKGLKEFFSNILIYIDKKDYTVDHLDMREASGDNTLIRFTQKQLNVPIADEVFAVR